ncbi:MAG TPA: transcriptional regulator [Actinomycetota bacterium]|nr:transcriptional regulator [Actinomycetota bacterium]
MDRDRRAARAIGSLADDHRWAMYAHIRESRRPLSREEVAAEIGISTKLAAFHLDKLVDLGLLKAHYARRGPGGPGAGRPSKLYEATTDEMSVSVPPRGYGLVGSMLLEALDTRTDTESALEAARRVGRAFGVTHGAESGRDRRLEEVLGSLGFEPMSDGAALALGNCPFHALAQKNPELVCGMNEAFMAGLLEGLGDGTVTPTLAPQPGRCCVVFQPIKESA